MGHAIAKARLKAEQQEKRLPYKMKRFAEVKSRVQHSRMQGGASSPTRLAAGGKALVNTSW